MKKTKKKHKIVLFVQWISLLVYSFSKNAASYADKRTSFTDSERVIIAHAHGYFLEIGSVLEVSFLHFAEEAGKRMELTSYLYFVFRVGSHAHHARYAYIIQCLPFTGFQHGTAFVRREAEFGFLLGNVDLEQTRDDASSLHGQLV